MNARFRGPAARRSVIASFIGKRGITARKTLLVGLICVSVLSLFASPTTAQQPQTFFPGAWVDSGPAPTLGGPTPALTGKPLLVGEASKTFPKVIPGGGSAKLCKGTIHSKQGRRCATYKGGRLTKVCTVRSGRGRTCRLFNKNGQVFRICVTRPGEPTRCRRVKAAQALGMGNTNGGPFGQPSRKALGLNDQGFGPLIPAVGAIWSGNEQICTGTLIARGIVLTAGHCLWVNDLLAPQLGGTTYRGLLPDIYFAPGQTWDDSFGLPLPSYPYGKWQAARWNVTSGWAQNDDGLDWGLIELLPDANGNYPGDFTGTFLAHTKIEYGPGAHVYLAGYPSSGLFATDALHKGYGQYHCNSTWDGAWHHNFLANGSWTNWSMTHACTMNGGSSGGPVFVELSDGSWVIGGVISRGHDIGGYSDVQHAPFLYSGLLDFYNSF